MTSQESLPAELLERVAGRTTMGALRSGLLGRYIMALKEAGASPEVVRAELPIMFGITGNERQLSMLAFRVQLDTGVAVEQSVIPVTKSQRGGGDVALAPFTPEDVLALLELDDQNLRDGVWYTTTDRPIVSPQPPHDLHFDVPSASDITVVYRPRRPLGNIV